jgi:hypothetical protein
VPLLFCWCRKPVFNLAVVDLVKPVIGQVASIVYCTCAQVKTPKTTDETISKHQHRKSVVEQKKNTHKWEQIERFKVCNSGYHGRAKDTNENRKISKSATRISLATSGFRLLQDTATLSSYFWITLQQHAAYNGSINRHHTFHHLAATSKPTADLSKNIKILPLGKDSVSTVTLDSSWQKNTRSITK